MSCCNLLCTWLNNVGRTFLYLSAVSDSLGEISPSAHSCRSFFVPVFAIGIYFVINFFVFDYIWICLLPQILIISYYLIYSYYLTFIIIIYQWCKAKIFRDTTSNASINHVFLTNLNISKMHGIFDLIIGLEACIVIARWIFVIVLSAQQLRS